MFVPATRRQCNTGNSMVVTESNAQWYSFAPVVIRFKLVRKPESFKFTDFMGICQSLEIQHELLTSSLFDIPSSSTKLFLVWTLSLQESPPTWMQEANCPPRSKYSFCCPSQGGTPSWPGLGGVFPILGWGVGYPRYPRVWMDTHLWKHYLPAFRWKCGW